MTMVPGSKKMGGGGRRSKPMPGGRAGRADAMARDMNNTASRRAKLIKMMAARVAKQKEDQEETL
jgi:hypothetical protein